MFGENTLSRARYMQNLEFIFPFGGQIHSLTAARTQFLKDLYNEAAQDVCSKLTSGRILDIGTGPGYLPIEIAKRSPNLEVVGIDISSGMLKVANRNAIRMGLAKRVRFQFGYAEKLPFEDQYFNFVLSTISLHHWLNPADCTKEIYRVLRDDGEALIYEIRRDLDKEVALSLRRQHGWLFFILFLILVKSHPFVTLKEVEEIVSSSGGHFSKKSLKDDGIILKLRFSK